MKKDKIETIDSMSMRETTRRARKLIERIDLSDKKPVRLSYYYKVSPALDFTMLVSQSLADAQIIERFGRYEVTNTLELKLKYRRK